MRARKKKAQSVRNLAPLDRVEHETSAHHAGPVAGQARHPAIGTDRIGVTDPVDRSGTATVLLRPTPLVVEGVDLQIQRAQRLMAEERRRDAEIAAANAEAAANIDTGVTGILEA